MDKLKKLLRWKADPITKALIVSSVLSNTGWAFINPILAIYVINNIKGGSIQVIGVCYFIYWVVKGLLQLFVADSLDKVKGEGDDYFTLLLGRFFVALVPIAFLFAKTPAELYLIFFVFGIGDALYVPPWNAIFTRHVNPNRVSFQWALNSTGFNLGAAMAIIIGSSFAVAFGFRTVFVLVAIAQIISLVIITRMRSYFVGKKKTEVKYFFPLEG